MIKHILLQIRLFPRNRREPYLLFYKVLGFYPRKIEYYQLAVQHKSVAISRNTSQGLSNERLEFLGDAVLNSVISDILYLRFEREQEGFLTNTRSKIVKRESLNYLALQIGLDKLLKVSNYVNNHTNNNIYGNALEALVGAIYLDYGYARCRKFVEQRLLRDRIDLDSLSVQEANFKSKLIEWCQKHRFEPSFILVNETLGKANKRLFETELYFHDKYICSGTGINKKQSEQNASFEALQLIESNAQLLD